MTRTFTACVEFDSETKLYVGTIPGLPGGHSQGATLDELRENLQEVVELILEESMLRENLHEIGVEPDEFSNLLRSSG